MGEAPERPCSCSRSRTPRRSRSPPDAKLAYITQTTLSVDETAEIIAALRRRFPEIYAPKKEDICYATSNRQWAVKELIGEIDLLLVIGSRNSSNSNRLVEVARADGVPAYLIDDETEIDQAWLDGVRDGRRHLGRLRSRVARRARLRLVPGARRRPDRAVPHGGRGRHLPAADRAPARARDRGGAGLKLALALAALVVVGAAAAAAGYLLGARDEAADEAATDSGDAAPKTTVVPAGWKLCARTSVSATRSPIRSTGGPRRLTAESECTFFDPQPIQLPENERRLRRDARGGARAAVVRRSSSRASSTSGSRRYFERRELTISRPAGRRGRLAGDRRGAARPRAPSRRPTWSTAAAEPPLMLRTVRSPTPTGRSACGFSTRPRGRSCCSSPANAAAEETAPPDAVLRKRAAMLAAAPESDYDALAQLADPHRVRVHVRRAGRRGPAAYWREADARGEEPTRRRARGDPPAAVHAQPRHLRLAVRLRQDRGRADLVRARAAAPAGLCGAFSDGYLGWRAGIRPDGRWVFFVAGD